MSELTDRLGGYTLRATFQDFVERVRDWNFGRGQKVETHGKIADTRRPKYTAGSVIPMVKQTTYVLPPFPISYRDMYNLSDLQPVLRTCKMAIRNETFRNGAKWIPRYTARCDTCNIEYEKKHPDEPCSHCGGEMHGPDPNEYAEADRFFEYCNLNSQSIIDVMMTCDEDISVTDAGYVVNRFDYETDLDGNIVNRKIKETVRGSPILMRKIIDETGIPGGLHYVCPVHRDQVFHIKTKDTDVFDDDEVIEVFEGQRCPKCNRKLYDVHYVSLRNEGGDIQQYFIEGEVIDYHVYSSSMAYGMPPLLTLWVPASFLLYQEVYMRDAYERRRSPNRAITVRTGNPDSFLNMWDRIMEKVKRDQWYTPVIPLEAEPGGYNSGDISVVDFLPVVREMDYIGTRDEARQRICALYGVSNVFMADMRTVGAGATNEGLQILVTNRTVQKRQFVYNRTVFPKLVRDVFGIKDWYYVLKPNEERDRLKELQETQMEIQAAQQMVTLGFEPDRAPDGEFTFYKAQNVTGGMPMQSDGMQTFTPNVSEQYYQGQPEMPTQKAEDVLQPEDDHYNSNKFSKNNPPPPKGIRLKLSDFSKGDRYEGVPVFKQLQSVPSKIQQPVMPGRKPAKLIPAQMPPKVNALNPRLPQPHDAPGFKPVPNPRPTGRLTPEVINMLQTVLQYLRNYK